MKAFMRLVGALGIVAPLGLTGISSAVLIRPAEAQTIVDGSDQTMPAADRAGLLGAVQGNLEMGVNTQVARVRPLNLNGRLYYCGQVSVAGSPWTPFYFDSFSGGSRVGLLASDICG